MDRVTKAEELFKSGYNCSQSVIGAVCEDLGYDFDTAVKIAEGFGGGMGRMRLTCGAVSGMVMAVGMLLSSGKADNDTRAVVYAKVKDLADKFKAENGTITCSELLGLEQSKEYNATPDARTAEYYKKRPCVELVKECVQIIEDELI